MRQNTHTHRGIIRGSRSYWSRQAATQRSSDRAKPFRVRPLSGNGYKSGACRARWQVVPMGEGTTEQRKKHSRKVLGEEGGKDLVSSSGCWEDA